MTPSDIDNRLKIEECPTGDAREQMRREVTGGLTSAQKTLPCKYFYDKRGSELFEQICNLPEYYQTRTELSILEAAAPGIMRHMRSGYLVELGSGANRKIRLLLDAADRGLDSITYVPIDVCRPALTAAASELCMLFPSLRVRAVVADFNRFTERLNGHEEKLIAFFGGTFGNLDEEEAAAFLARCAAAMQRNDRLLVGLDLVKPKHILEAAYNDSRGITAAFNRNILSVLNREMGLTFDLSTFDHCAWYDDDFERIEMHLRALKALRIRIPHSGRDVRMQEGETIRTEISRKFRKAGFGDVAARAGLSVVNWHADAREWFALAELMRA